MDSGILEDLNLYPYTKNEVYSLDKDYFVFHRKNLNTKYTSSNLIVCSGVKYGGEILPKSIYSWEKNKAKYRSDIMYGLEKGLELRFLYVAYVKDWYSNVNIYYSVFEDLNGKNKYLIEHGRFVENRKFTPYPSIN
jgi:hypothetical protein